MKSKNQFVKFISNMDEKKKVMNMIYTAVADAFRLSTEPVCISSGGYSKTGEIKYLKNNSTDGVKTDDVFFLNCNDAIQTDDASIIEKIKIITFKYR